MKLGVQEFFHADTNTFSYVVWDPQTLKGAIIDPVLDYDPKAGRTRTVSADGIVTFVQEQNLAIDWILETHAHADHLTSAQYLKGKLGGSVAIGVGITRVQETFKDILNLKDLATDGRQFDRLFKDRDRFQLGSLTGHVIATPGHTSDSLTFLIEDAAFVGDTLFAPDYGTARVDFPGGDAEKLYRSIHRIFELPDQTRIFLCHDYPPEGRGPECVHTLAEQRARNIHIHDGIQQKDFVEMRHSRDAKLSLPRLIIPAIQINICAGQFPPPEDNGIAYLKVPLNRLGK